MIGYTKKRNDIVDINDLIESFENSMPGELLPFIGKLFQYNKNKQFQKRIKANEDKLKRVFEIIPNREYEFFGEKIGTLVIEKIFLDEQDDKIE